MFWRIRQWLTQPLAKGIAAMSQAQLDAIASVKAQLTKSKDEIVSRIASLEEALGNATATDDPAVTAALADLKGVAQSLDDLNPDPEQPAG